LAAPAQHGSDHSTDRIAATVQPPSSRTKQQHSRPAPGSLADTTSTKATINGRIPPIDLAHAADVNGRIPPIDLAHEADVNGRIPPIDLAHEAAIWAKQAAVNGRIPPIDLAHEADVNGRIPPIDLAHEAAIWAKQAAVNGRIPPIDLAHEADVNGRIPPIDLAHEAGSLQLPGRRNFHRHSRPGPAKRPLEASKVAPGRCRLASAGAEGERRSLATSSSCEPLLQQATSAAASYGPNLLSRHFWPAIAAGALQALAAWTGRANPADSSPRLLHLRLDQGIRLVLALVPLHAGVVAPVAKQQLRGNEHPSGQPCKATGVAARAA
jgi:hypothetical protein